MLKTQLMLDTLEAQHDGYPAHEHTALRTGLISDVRTSNLSEPLISLKYWLKKRRGGGSAFVTVHGVLRGSPRPAQVLMIH